MRSPRGGLQTAGLLAAMVGLEVVGNGCLSRGMRQVGPVVWGALTPAAVLGLALRVGTNPWVVVGVLTLVGYFLCYLTALSRMDLSYVLPMAASSYLLTAGFAWGMLGERISSLRWCGTGLIAVGLIFIQTSARPPRAEAARP